MVKLKKFKSLSEVLTTFTDEIESASKNFVYEFKEAVHHNPALGKQAEGFAFDVKRKAGDLKYKCERGFTKLDDKISGTSEFEKKVKAFEKSIEHSAERFTNEIDKFVRKNFKINIGKVGKAFGGFLEKFVKAIVNLISGVNAVITDKNLQQAMQKAPAHHAHASRDR